MSVRDTNSKQALEDLLGVENTAVKPPSKTPATDAFKAALSTFGVTTQDAPLGKPLTLGDVAGLPATPSTTPFTDAARATAAALGMDVVDVALGSPLTLDDVRGLPKTSAQSFGDNGVDVPASDGPNND